MLPNYEDFKREAASIVQSSDWVTDKANEIVEEYCIIEYEDNIDPEYLDQLYQRMTYLENRINFEEINHKKFVEKYKEYLT